MQGGLAWTFFDTSASSPLACLVVSDFAKRSQIKNGSNCQDDRWLRRNSRCFGATKRSQMITHALPCRGRRGLVSRFMISATTGTGQRRSKCHTMVFAKRTQIKDGSNCQDDRWVQRNSQCFGMTKQSQMITHALPCRGRGSLVSRPMISATTKDQPTLIPGPNQGFRKTKPNVGCRPASPEGAACILFKKR